MTQMGGSGAGGDRPKGVGPLIPPLTETQRPLRQQIFERIRAAGLIPRVTLARELDVSPASVTTGDVAAGNGNSRFRQEVYSLGLT